MPKMAATLFGSRPDLVLSDPVAVAPHTRCLLCGEWIHGQAYLSPDWGSVSNWDAFAGVATASAMILCADCDRLVELFHEHKEWDATTQENKFVAIERLGSGWHRAVAGATEMEHYSFAVIKKSGMGDTARTPYWVALHQAIFEPRAHAWVLMRASRQGNLESYLPYTPARSSYLTILTDRAGFYTVRLRRTVLWDTICRVSKKELKIDAIADSDLRHIVRILVPAGAYPEFPVPAVPIESTKSEEAS